jgi:uncharacterized membrane protein YeiH
MHLSLITIFEHSSIGAAAISGALAARGRGIDLFGVLVLALVTSFGGGTLRDLCLGDTPVFWIRESSHVITALICAVVTFVVGRFHDLPLPAWLLEAADAIGLALFAVIGTQKAFGLFGATPLAAVALGTLTGVSGGVLRDVLLNEIPLVFRKEIRLYATAAAAGAVVYVCLVKYAVALPATVAFIASVTVILGLRLAAVRWKLVLPDFEDLRGKR